MRAKGEDEEVEDVGEIEVKGGWGVGVGNSDGRENTRGVESRDCREGAALSGVSPGVLYDMRIGQIFYSNTL